MDGLSNIFARNCEVRRIHKPEASAFLERNHRLGATGGRYFYGLFVKRSTGAGELQLPAGTMVAAASFSQARTWQKPEGSIRSYEWIRYASLEGTRVVGGMGKLLDAFIEEVHPDDIMSYADLGWPDGGKAYLELGFKPESEIERGGARCMKYRRRFYQSLTVPDGDPR